MSVIVKGMEMPQNCAFCPLSKYRNTSLGLVLDCKRIGTVGTAFRDTHNVLEHRHPDCPLVEIPTPHGRLGDLDALYEEISNGNKAYNGFDGYDGKYPNIGNVDDCLDAIKYADTIIEAEGETE